MSLGEGWTTAGRNKRNKRGVKAEQAWRFAATTDVDELGKGTILTLCGQDTLRAHMDISGYDGGDGQVVVQSLNYTPVSRFGNRPAWVLTCRDPLKSNRGPAASAGLIKILPAGLRTRRRRVKVVAGPRRRRPPAAGRRSVTLLI
eukprot:SAG31_NODE_6717_length_1912_cov_29.734694_4_plen_145_part_00